MIRFVLIAVAVLASPVAYAAERLVVVELFTSQGCPNCPPAQTILEEVAAEDSVLALSWPVDYWDFMGWKDTLARRGNAERQKDYNRQLGQPGVYTPQVVVDGRIEAIGSRRDTVRNRLEQARALPREDVAVQLDAQKGYCVISMPDISHDGAIYLEAVYYLAEKDVAIGEGDNRGRVMRYTNVVLASRSLGEWTPGGQGFSIPIAEATDIGADHMAILLHLGEENGPIVGAASMAVSSAL